MSHRRPVLLAAAVATAAAVFLPASGQAASRTRTLRVYDKAVSTTLTLANGVVVTHAPYPEPKAGDTLDVDSLDYRGNHVHHAEHWLASTHLRCVFRAAGPPACESHVAIGGSMLVFTGNPGTVTNGTGIFHGATGRVISSKDVPGTDAADVVARIRLAR